jgi:hypothetical protein
LLSIGYSSNENIFIILKYNVVEHLFSASPHPYYY